MRQRAGATTHRLCKLARVLVVALAALSGSGTTYAADSPAETEQLAAILRQLDTLERIINSRPTSETRGQSRYHFDYSRLNADIARVRAGIDDYLRPSRAQPRDPAQLIGEYRLPNGTP